MKWAVFWLCDKHLHRPAKILVESGRRMKLYIVFTSVLLSVCNGAVFETLSVDGCKEDTGTGGFRRFLVPRIHKTPHAPTPPPPPSSLLLDNQDILSILEYGE